MNEGVNQATISVDSPANCNQLLEKLEHNSTFDLCSTQRACNELLRWCRTTRVCVAQAQITVRCAQAAKHRQPIITAF